MRKRLVWPVVAALGLTLGLTAPTGATAAPALSPALPPALSPVAEQLPALKALAEAGQARLGLTRSPMQDAALAAIDPTQYECSAAPPPVLSAILPDATNWTPDQRLAATLVLIFDIPMVDAVYLPQSGPFTYGADGDFTSQVNRTDRSLRTFWDIPSAGIELVPAHGHSLLNPAVSARVLTALYGVNPATAQAVGELIAVQLNTPALNQGDLPVFTFNAYAASGGEVIPGYPTAVRRIVLGDGVLDGFAKVGLGDVAPRAILAHEFGHQVQFADNLMRTDLPAPEASRWAELMADAFSSYFLAHARGGAVQWKRAQQFSQVFFQVGDCGFSAPGHHGTPTQRMRTALWAYTVADTASPQGHILPALTFHGLFVAQYPQLIAPDA
ncbi:hypothetical protein GCM10009745_37630 [Kribbella yunnanensis]|uniref:Uncharacterized protein n=1 Tax=Kribbella yunnanensis TaxID=190194 RepID=A0ABP4TKI1_9ACTN